MPCSVPKVADRLREFQAEIVDLSHDGRGVARMDGKVAFIADALPGEQVTWRRTRRKRQADEGQMLSVEQASVDRVAPQCPHFGVCGGCALQHLSPEKQLSFKQKQMLDALERIGGVKPETVADAVTGPVWGYRRKARLAVRYVHKKDRVLVGFRERHAPYVADIQACEVLDPRVGRELLSMADLISQLSIREQLPQIEVATADHVVLVFRVLSEPSAEDLALIRAYAQAHDFEIYLQPGGMDTVAPLEPPARGLHYSPDGSDLRLNFEPADFIQVNGPVAQRMVQQALEWLAPQAGERLLELFCGLGNFSLPLAARGLSVTALEGDAGLIQRARANAEAQGQQIDFKQADLFKVDGQEPWLNQTYDAVLLDPPRSGAKEVIPFIGRMAPARIVYVSCHPGTLARDAQTLVRDHGYVLKKAGVLDMFPHTAHVESMALFVKEAG